MDIFEYVAVLVSIIIGLGMAHLLRGLVRMIQHPGRHPAYWVHLGWVVYMFFSLIFWWWWEFRLGELDSWTFDIYLFVIFYAFLLFVASALLFPDDMDGYESYKEYFYDRRRWFFGLLAFNGIVDLFDTLLKGVDYFQSLGLEYLVMNPTLSLVQLVGAFTRNERYHQVLVIVCIVYQVSWAVRMFATVA